MYVGGGGGGVGGGNSTISPFFWSEILLRKNHSHFSSGENLQGGKLLSDRDIRVPKS